LDIYHHDNALKFFQERCKFERSSIKKIRDIFLLPFRKCTRNPSLNYSVPLEFEERPKIKHYIKYDELKTFMEFLRKEKDYELNIIFEILYKFGVRISAIAKLKVKDLYENKLIIFHEKNQKIIQRKLKYKLFNKLKKLIKNNSLKSEDFLFYSYLCPKDIDDRAKLFSNILAKVLKKSQCFDKKENETIGAHMFRATHSINIFQKTV
jgi:integrase